MGLKQLHQIIKWVVSIGTSTTSLGRNLTKSSNTKLTKYNSFVENRDGYFGIGRAMNLS
jgi:hypothetical protein